MEVEGAQIVEPWLLMPVEGTQPYSKVYLVWRGAARRPLCRLPTPSAEVRKRAMASARRPGVHTMPKGKNEAHAHPSS